MFKRIVEIDMKNSKSITVVPIGDVHVGRKDFDENLFSKTIQEIKNKNYFVIGIGDYIDNIQTLRKGGTDSRFDIYTANRKLLTTEEQTVYFNKYWNKIKNNILGVLWGNHEDANMLQSRFIHDFCFGDKKLFLGRSGVIILKLYRYKKLVKTYKFLVTHGNSTSSTDTSLFNNLVTKLKSTNADIALQGHTHAKGVLKIPLFDLDKNRVKERLVCITGSFLGFSARNESDYIDIPLLTGNIIGAVKIRLNEDSIEAIT